jgi:hypothetical protein
LLFQDLETLVPAAKAEVQKIEFVSDQEDWVKALEATVLTIRAWFRDPTGATDPPTEQLHALTTQNQKGLSDELARIAKRLKADDLSESAKNVLQALAKARQQAAIDEPQIKRFDETCLRVVGLVDDHAACQFADTALLVTVGRNDIAPGIILKWAKLKSGFEGLAKHRPQDGLAKDVGRLASEFENGSDAGRQATFASFREQFDNLFLEIDRELLDATTDLVDQVAQLGATLEGFLRGRRGK